MPSKRSGSPWPSTSTACSDGSTASTSRASRRSASSPAGSRADGEELEPALITKHLQFSLPYRALFSQTLRPDTATRLLDALSLLLVRLHLAGFLWKDCSLSNTLFRRDAGAFAAYLVDAETGELHDKLSDGQREHDLDVALVNIYGEFLDLEAGGMLHPSVDPQHTAEAIIRRYHSLWGELGEALVITASERYKVNDKVRRLNDLGFDVGEFQVVAEEDGTHVRVRPKVVDAGHHSRRLLRLTGLDVQENQARRLLNDLDAYRSHLELPPEDEELVAHRWVAEVFEPVVQSVPRRCAASSSRRRSSTRCSSTCGSCPSDPARTSASRRPRSPTSPACWPTDRTSSRCSASGWAPRATPPSPSPRSSTDPAARPDPSFVIMQSWRAFAG